MPDIPYPFERNLIYTLSPSGTDVYILTELLRRHFADTLKDTYIPNTLGSSKKTAVYSRDVALLVRTFQNDVGLPATGIFESETAKKILSLYAGRDNYRDKGVKARDFKMKYKIYVPVYRDRSIETTAILYDQDNNELYKFIARTHGKTDPKKDEWPQYDMTVGQNEFVNAGNTPTGLAYLDFNSPEPPAYFDQYGPYNVNRVTVGIKGNAALILPHIRNGILIHTGNWQNYGWDGKGPMPNSSGCLHVHPNDAKRISEILLKLGVIANENPFGELPYPFEPQGIISVELIDE